MLQYLYKHHNNDNVFYFAMFELKNKNLDALFMCVTNTPIAKSISEKISAILNDKTIIIDITTHNQNGSIETEAIFKKNITYEKYRKS